VIAEREFRTNEYGHFSGRLRLRGSWNSTPDTWTVEAALISPKANPKPVRREVKFVSDTGVSVISDIDDTVKNTAILSGARELFRNTFVRDLGSMAIEGVKEWYEKMIRMGAQVHYVSNSPYQCWPIIQSFMDKVGLPMGGSVHLKQYSGMISGIMENAADKKRAGVDSIIRVFTNLEIC
jgi:phosphatidate phosphatase APP1